MFPFCKRPDSMSMEAGTWCHIVSAEIDFNADR
jgi:hypothetical protein